MTKTRVNVWRGRLLPNLVPMLEKKKKKKKKKNDEKGYFHYIHYQRVPAYGFDVNLIDNEPTRFQTCKMKMFDIKCIY